ncbi:hypothetical protein LMG29542_07816 [Paraburkholderia humisilvae]|uniref:Uncharacterized protein n=1 Tax=Paraburkholderia humisilvae TaxID=627669 RepID=A0A6J5F6L1_9BURK|nr:hypothetical protein LMG29542_07816 [Paraburkholderia humisilvae]
MCYIAQLVQLDQDPVLDKQHALFALHIVAGLSLRAGESGDVIMRDNRAVNSIDERIVEPGLCMPDSRLFGTTISGQLSTNPNAQTCESIQSGNCRAQVAMAYV